jgi:hypothetical protein
MSTFLPRSFLKFITPETGHRAVPGDGRQKHGSSLPFSSTPHALVVRTLIDCCGAGKSRRRILFTGMRLLERDSLPLGEGFKAVIRYIQTDFGLWRCL